MQYSYAIRMRSPVASRSTPLHSVGRGAEITHNVGWGGGSIVIKGEEQTVSPSPGPKTLKFKKSYKIVEKCKSLMSPI